MTLPLSGHALGRIQQRGISDVDVAVALEAGKRLNTAGATFYFLGRREAANLGDRKDKLNGLTVLQAADGTIITAYKNPRALSRIKRKLKRGHSYLRRRRRCCL
jgi:hypothetical protein